MTEASVEWITADEFKHEMRGCGIQEGNEPEITKDLHYLSTRPEMPSLWEVLLFDLSHGFNWLSGSIDAIRDEDSQKAIDIFRSYVPSLSQEEEKFIPCIARRLEHWIDMDDNF